MNTKKILAGHMLEALERHGVSCDRCYERPHLRDCLGCGKPPTRDDDPMRALWRLEDGKLLSPAMAVEMGEPAYTDLGVDSVRQDWPWCPRWFHEFSQTTVCGVPTVEYMRSVQMFAECQELGSFVRPPWTQAFLQLFNYWRLVRAAAERQRDQKAQQEARSKWRKS